MAALKLYAFVFFSSCGFFHKKYANSFARNLQLHKILIPNALKSPVYDLAEIGSIVRLVGNILRVYCVCLKEENR